MKKKLILFTIILSASISLEYANGPASWVGQGYTGAPGESGTVCGSCHTGGTYGVSTATLAVNSGGSPVTTYIGGQTYQISLTANAGMGAPAAYGFQLTVLDASNNDVANFANPSTNAKISTAAAIAGGRTYAEHNGPSGAPVNTFTFDWVAPAATTGQLTFYYAVNVVNLNNQTTQDNGSNGFSTAITENILPVKWLEFEVSNTSPNQVDLHWSTANEVNNEVFELEYSTDGRRFELLSTILGSGNTNAREDYSFVHKTRQNGTVYYRIKQVDYDGNFSYSKVKSIKLEGQRIFSIYPNPVSETLYVESNEKDLSIHIFNSLGKKVRTSSSTQIDVATLEKGIYFLQAVVNGKLETHTFMKTN